jgi:DNA-binding SARP family transcriptional activator
LAVLKAIIAFGARGVPETVLLDTIWPDSHGDAARLSLNSALYRLRRLLRNKNIVTRRDTLIGLDLRFCWVDVWTLETALDQTENVFMGSGRLLNPEQLETIEQTLDLYRGSFLDADQDAPWAKPVADRLRRRMVIRLTQLGRYWTDKDPSGQATRYYEKAISIEPCAEDVCRDLMSIYHKLGRPAEVINVYEQLRDSLRRRIGVRPSAQTEALLKQLIQREDCRK